MTFHKQKQYDETEAFLLNERQQKLLVLKLDRIDKLWYSKLKNLSRDRLEATTELVRLEEDKQQLAYYDHSMDVHKMKSFNDGCIRQMRSLQREMSHDNFDFENSPYIQRKKSAIVQNGTTINFPKLEHKSIVTQAQKSKKKKQSKKRPVKALPRRQSNLMRHRVFSVSDSNLDKVSKTKEPTAVVNLSVSNEDISNTSRINMFISKLSQSDEVSGVEEDSSKTVLPTIEDPKQQLANPDVEHRYLKQRMATQLVLPTVREVETRQRKLSV